MGIPHLANLLQPYREPLELGLATGDTQRQRVVIDGPGLAHHAYYVARSRRGESCHALEAIPPYAQVNSAAVGILDHLTARGVEIAAIYFDGKLPDAKQDVRRARLQQSLQQLTAFRSLYPKGLPSQPNKPRGTGGAESDLSVKPIRAHLKLLPPAPFIVPAVVEALLDTVYAAVVHIVPGEADAYCARDVKDQRGLVLTGDSDLLVYDLGRSGGVLFFNELSLDEQILKAHVYVPANIARRLEVGSIMKLAFVVSRNRGKRLSECLQITRRLQNANTAYLAFAGDYKAQLSQIEVLPGRTLVRDEARTPLLDVRVSEYVLQGPAAERTMYLPFILDDPTRFSAWTCGTVLRLLAYSLLSQRVLHSTTSAAEVHRRGQGQITESRLPLFKAPELLLCAAAVVNDMERWQAKVTPRHGVEYWRSFSVMSIVEEFVASGRPLPGKQQIRCLLAAQPSTSDWSYVHLRGCHQALTYSLRILRQVLDFVYFDERADIAGDNRQGSVRQLQARLSSLPGTAALLDADVPMDGTDDCLEAICEKYNIVEQPVTKAARPKPRRSKPDQNPKPAEAGSESNRFAALADAG